MASTKSGESAGSKFLSTAWDAWTNKNDYIPAYSFSLWVDAQVVPLRSVKPFRYEAEYDVIQEGGVNDYVHLVRKGVTKPFTLTVERYADTSIVLETLSVGYESTLPMLLLIYNAAESVSSKMPLRTYVLTGTKVMSKEYGELNSERSGLLTETVTIAYKTITCVNSDISKIGNLLGSFGNLFG